MVATTSASLLSNWPVSIAAIGTFILATAAVINIFAINIERKRRLKGALAVDVSSDGVITIRNSSDGQIDIRKIKQYRLSDQEVVSLRISIIPSFYGENVVMRLLDSHAHQYSLENLIVRQMLEIMNKN